MNKQTNVSVVKERPYKKVKAFNRGAIDNSVFYGERMTPSELIRFDYLEPFKRMLSSSFSIRKTEL